MHGLADRIWVLGVGLVFSFLGFVGCCLGLFERELE